MQDASITVSICLSDLKEAKQYIKKATNGKLYISLEIRGRKEPDNYGNDIYAFLSQTKEEREAQTPKTFVGNGRYFDFKKQEKVQDMPVANDEDLDDLPF